MILAGDIGGTKTNLALFSQSGSTLELVAKHQFSSRETETFDEVIAQFLKLTNIKKVEKACFGVAGPVINQECKTTNLPWELSATNLQKTLGAKKVYLLNDLGATAYGMLHLGEDEFISLNPNGVKRQGNCAIIAAGTGLGEAMLFYDGKNHHPVASEGGHSDFAPNTPQQDNLLKWMRKRFGSHVSFERVLSGPGIYTIYEFLLDSDYAPQPTAMIQAKKDDDKSALISQCAIEKNDKLCKETLRLFCEIYGAEAGNLALKTLSLGGVYIGGGIAPKILPFMRDKIFMEAFLNKGRFRELLSSMEVKISLNNETALLGAAYFAARD